MSYETWFFILTAVFWIIGEVIFIRSKSDFLKRDFESFVVSNGMIGIVCLLLSGVTLGGYYLIKNIGVLYNWLSSPTGLTFTGLIGLIALKYILYKLFVEVKE